MNKKLNKLINAFLIVSAVSFSSSFSLRTNLDSQDIQRRLFYESKALNQNTNELVTKRGLKKVKINYEKIIYIESRGNPKAYNRSSGARGLMQITPIVLEEWNKRNPNKKYILKDLYDPKINKEIGIWCFKRIEDCLLEKDLGLNLENILAGYNWGVGNVINTGEINQNFYKLPKETQRYIRSYKDRSLRKRE